MVDLDQIIKYAITENGETVATVNSRKLFVYTVELMYNSEYLSVRQLASTLRFDDLEFSVFYINEGAYVEENDIIVSIKYSYIPNRKVSSLFDDITVRTKKSGYVLGQYDFNKDRKISETNNVIFRLGDKSDLPFIKEGDNEPNGTFYEVHFCHEAYDDHMLSNILYMDKIPSKPISLQWFVKTGEDVHKGQLLCLITTPQSTYEVKSKYDGCIYIEKFDAIPAPDNEYDFGIDDGDILYTLYHDQKTLISRKFQSFVSMEEDSFTGSKNIVWEYGFAGRAFDEFGIDTWDCFEMMSRNGQSLYISFFYFEGHRQMIFGAKSREINMSKGDEVALLLKDEATGEFHHLNYVLENSYNSFKHSLFDVAFSTVISSDDIFMLSEYDCVGWRVATYRKTYQGENYSSWTPASIAPVVLRNAVREYKDCLSDNDIPEEHFDVTKDNSVYNAPSAEACSVYLMHDVANGYYKIGMSNNPVYRESTLQSEKPTIELLCSKEFPSRALASAIESALHKVYDAKRLRGEWFSLAENDVSEIKIVLS